jgi:hypothetical protein
LKETTPPEKKNRFIAAFTKLQAYITENSASFRNRFLTFLIFVLLSSVLWVYRTLDDTFVANIDYPVQFQNLPKNKILVGTPPEKIRLRVRGSGYSLLSNKIKFKTPLNFSINSFLLYSQANDSMSVYILTEYAQDALNEELSIKSNDLEILSISPDTIFFNFTRTRAKKIPIVPNIINNDNMVARQHILNGNIRAIPDSITIIGPASMIDTIEFLTTKPLQPTELSDTFNKKVALIKIEQIQIPLKKVMVQIPVDRFTQLSYDVPIYTRHVPDSINMKLFPRVVNVSFNISYSNISMISDADFRPYVDFKEIEPNSKRIRIKIDSIPKEVHSLRLNHSSVEFINVLNNAENRDNRGDR